MVTLDDIRTARERIAGAVDVTPCIEPYALSELCGADLRLKLETLQRTGSFKARGAVNTLRSLTAEERERGVIASSAGNHAQGVAYAASITGARATIVMPRTTPLIKIDRTRALGAEVVLHGDGFDDAYDHALEIQEERGLTFIHAFDDDRVIAGQGTLALELLEEVPDLDVVVTPCGGGGLLSGVLLASTHLRPGIRGWGVEPEAGNDMQLSVEKGEPVEIPLPATIADSLQTTFVAQRTLAVVRALAAGILTVSDLELRRAMGLLAERMKLVVEPGGSAAFAALLHGKVPEVSGRRVGVVLSGGNVDLARFGQLVAGPDLAGF